MHPLLTHQLADLHHTPRRPAARATTHRAADVRSRPAVRRRTEALRRGAPRIRTGRDLPRPRTAGGPS
jgi:hypothetical protein